MDCQPQQTNQPRNQAPQQPHHQWQTWPGGQTSHQQQTGDYGGHRMYSEKSPRADAGSCRQRHLKRHHSGEHRPSETDHDHRAQCGYCGQSGRINFSSTPADQRDTQQSADQCQAEGFAGIDITAPLGTEPGRNQESAAVSPGGKHRSQQDKRQRGAAHLHNDRFPFAFLASCHSRDSRHSDP